MSDTYSNKRSRRLRLVSNGPSAGDTHDELSYDSSELDDETIDFIENWIERVRDFARNCDPRTFRSNRQANGKQGSTDYPVAVLIAMGDIRNFAADAYDPINGRGVPTRGEGITHTEEMIFEGFTNREINEFLRGFKEALTSLEVYSQLLAKQRDAVERTPSLGGSFVSFSLLETDTQVEIAYQLLEQSLDMCREMKEIADDFSLEMAAKNTPALFFDVNQVSRALNFASRDRAAREFVKGPNSSLPGKRAVELILIDPNNATQNYITEAEHYVLGLAHRGNHPLTGEPLAQQIEPKTQLEVVSNIPATELEVPSTLHAGPPELRVIKGIETQTPRDLA